MTVVAKTREGLRLRPRGLNRHIVGGVEIEAFACLCIETDAGEDGVVLVYCTETGEPVVQAWLDSVDEAMEQSEVEFGLGQKDWVFHH